MRIPAASWTASAALYGRAVIRDARLDQFILGLNQEHSNFCREVTVMLEDVTKHAFCIKPKPGTGTTAQASLLEAL